MKMLLNAACAVAIWAATVLFVFWAHREPYLQRAKAFCGGQLPCVVLDSPGGVVESFRKGSEAIREAGLTLTVAGSCQSACALSANLIRDRTCVTPNASFSFHKASDEAVPEGYLPEVEAYVEARGGWPSFKSGKFLTMPFEDAAKIWRTCDARRTAMAEAHMLGYAWANGFDWLDIWQQENPWLEVRKYPHLRFVDLVWLEVFEDVDRPVKGQTFGNMERIYYWSPPQYNSRSLLFMRQMIMMR